MTWFFSSRRRRRRQLRLYVVLASLLALVALIVLAVEQCHIRRRIHDVFNPFEVLGLDNEDFSLKTIKRHYRRAVLTYHIESSDLRNFCPEGYPRELWSPQNCHDFVHKAIISYEALVCLASCPLGIVPATGTAKLSSSATTCLRKCEKASLEGDGTGYTFTKCQPSRFGCNPRVLVSLPNPGYDEAWRDICIRAETPLCSLMI